MSVDPDHPHAVPGRPGSSPGLRRSILVAMAVLALGAAACTSGDSETGSESEAAPSTSTSAPLLPEGVTPDSVIALAGELAVVDAHRLTVMKPDGSEPIDVVGDDGLIASQPAWSPDGAQLAWAQTDGIRSTVEVALPRARAVSSSPFDSLPFYLGWNESGSRIAYLRNSPLGNGFEAGVVTGEEAVVTANGAPLYLSWRPESDELAIHRNNASVDVLDGTADISDPARPADAALVTTGQFATPVWLDSETLAVVQNGKLVLSDLDTREERVVLDIGDATRLVLSPDRTRLAYLTVVAGTQTVALPTQEGTTTTTPDATPPDTLPGGELEAGVRLRVFDFASGRDVLVTEELALAFEWSPDGAFVSWLGDAGAGLAQWHIWSRAGELTTLAPYRPSPLDRSAYLPYFDQYAQSQHRWDPDATAMAFAGIIGGQAGVWVQFIEGDFGPFLVSSGDYVTWSPPPGGGGGASIL